MPFAFQPGRFSPVVEIVAPDAIPDYFDNSVSHDFVEPTFNNAGNTRCILVSDGVPNCFESATLDSELPIVDPRQDVLFSCGSLAAVEGAELYGCSCLIDQFSILTIPDKPENMIKLEKHDCDACPLCTAVRQPWYNHHIWFKSYGRARPGALLRSSGNLPRHPTYPGFRFVAPHNVHNPWIVKFVTDEIPLHREHPVLSRDWLYRRRRYRDCPS